MEKALNFTAADEDPNVATLQLVDQKSTPRARGDQCGTASMRFEPLEVAYSNHVQSAKRELSPLLLPSRERQATIW